MVGATPAGEGDDEQQQQQQTKQGGGRKFVGMMVALVLIIGVISTKSLRATEQISEFLDTESEESKIGVDEVFVSPSPQTPPSPPPTPDTGSHFPSPQPPSNPSPTPVAEPSSGDDEDSVSKNCPQLEAGQVSISSLLDRDINISKDMDALRVTMDLANELWDFMAAGMPTGFVGGESEEVSGVPSVNI